MRGKVEKTPRSENKNVNKRSRGEEIERGGEKWVCFPRLVREGLCWGLGGRGEDDIGWPLKRER